jgi:hypothetical protein
MQGKTDVLELHVDDITCQQVPMHDLMIDWHSTWVSPKTKYNKRLLASQMMRWRRDERRERSNRL